MFAAELRVAPGGRRAAPRHALNLPGAIRTAHDGRCVCRVTDLSLGGARLELHNEIEPGSIIHLTLPGPQVRDGKLIWMRGLEAGCQFDEPLDERTLAELLRIYENSPPLARIPSSLITLI